MRSYVTLDPRSAGNPMVVDVDPKPGGGIVVRVDGKEVDVDAVAIGRQWSIRINGHIVDLTIDGAPPNLTVTSATGGVRSRIHVESERQKAERSTKSPVRTGSEKIIRSPMPGRIVKVLANEGQELTPGQAVVVIEAMKMENQINTKTGGTVAQVHVQVGVTVDGNAKLITLA